MNSTHQLNQSVLKSLKVLECLFAKGLSGVQLADICKVTELPNSTAWRLLHTLKHQGWVIDIPAEHAHRTTWRLTEKPARLAASYKRQALSLVQGVEEEYLQITREHLRNE